MWLAYLLTSLLVLLIVADLDKGTHMRIYVKAAPIEKLLKSPQNTTDHSLDSNSSFAHIPQSSVYNVRSQSNATFKHLIDEVLSIPINDTTDNLTSEKTTVNISTNPLFTSLPKFTATSVLSAIVSKFDFVSSPPLGNRSSNSSSVDAIETGSLNWTNAVWSTWLSETDNNTDDNSSSSVTQNNSHSSAWFSLPSAESNYSSENSSADLTPAPAIRSTGTPPSGLSDQLNGSYSISVITVTPPPLPTVAPLPIPITDSATASAAPTGTLSDRSGLGSRLGSFGSLASNEDTNPPDFGTGTSSLTENELDVELLQRKLNTALGIVLGFHQPTRNSDSHSDSTATIPPALISTSQIETESTDEDYSYEDAVLYRPLLDLSERVVAFLLASDGRRSEVPHSEGAEVRSSELLESNTTMLHLEDTADSTERESADRIGRLVTPTADADEEEAISASEERLAPELQSSYNSRFGNDSAETIRTTWELKQGDDSDDYFYTDSGENENNLTLSMMPF